MARTTLVAANWKMNGQREANEALLLALRAADLDSLSCDVLICPPALYMAQVSQLLADTGITLGAQNVYSQPQGAFTGEISARMLKDFACSHVLVGHSERRELFGETDAVVCAKFTAIQAEGLIPILCVGETEAERDAGQTEAVITRQLKAIMATLGADSLQRAVIAYEPVWAIGTGNSASPAQAQAVHAFIRALVAQEDPHIAAALQILYGGSVKAVSAGELFACEDIDGALVGGASLNADEFIAICRAA